MSFSGCTTNMHPVTSHNVRLCTSFTFWPVQANESNSDLTAGDVNKLTSFQQCMAGVGNCEQHVYSYVNG